MTEPVIDNQFIDPELFDDDECIISNKINTNRI